NGWYFGARGGGAAAGTARGAYLKNLSMCSWRIAASFGSRCWHSVSEARISLITWLVNQSSTGTPSTATILACSASLPQNCISARSTGSSRSVFAVARRWSASLTSPLSVGQGFFRFCRRRHGGVQGRLHTSAVPRRRCNTIAHGGQPRVGVVLALKTNVE